VVTGTGTEGLTEILFPAAVTGQIIRVTLTESASDPWVIGELRVLPSTD
jgi:hypothetical protein